MEATSIPNGPVKPFEQHEKEIIASLFREIAASLGNLAAEIARNKFPKVTFDVSLLAKLGDGIEIDRKLVARELETIFQYVRIIELPGDTRDAEGKIIKIHNFRSVISAMEPLNGHLVRMLNFFDQSSALNLAPLSNKTRKILDLLNSKKEAMEVAISIFPLPK